ncbi:hypothetical protein MSAN_01875200 [Mycena sanguinolenta]|uniref:Uncharacterized protein n=1 Tax=Mycena sanguinolenta TaxID=230812 RepID=A0A8H6XSL6_9AGAR|nr:hypothetical protein MSAN_01875200 [Mycena sanguinolenta]
MLLPFPQLQMFSSFFTPSEGIFSPWPGSLDTIEAMPWSDAFKRKGASWRRMLVSQPPVQTMTIEKISFQLGRRRAVLENLSLRMGVLYDLVVPFINDNKVAFRVHWDGKSELGGDLKLSVFHGLSRTRDMNSAVDSRFRCDGEKPVEIPFGEWELETWS